MKNKSPLQHNVSYKNSFNVIVKKISTNLIPIRVYIHAPYRIYKFFFFTIAKIYME